MMIMMRSPVTRVRLCNTLTGQWSPWSLSLISSWLISLLIWPVLRVWIMSWCHLSHEIRGGGYTADKQLRCSDDRSDKTIIVPEYQTKWDLDLMWESKSVTQLKRISDWSNWGWEVELMRIPFCFSLWPIHCSVMTGLLCLLPGNNGPGQADGHWVVTREEASLG